MSKIRILIADDQTLMRDGLKTILDLEEDMEVAGTAENGLEAYEMTRSMTPDMVLMDIRMPEMNGVESTRLIKKDFPQTVVLMLTTFDDEEYIIQALNYGASGYLLKDIQGDKLVQAVRDCASGNMIMPSAIAAKIANRLVKVSTENKSTAERLISQFSERELEISRLMVEGMSNKQIAHSLCISEGTTKNYISDIYSKIGISDRTKAVLYLKENCL